MADNRTQGLENLKSPKVSLKTLLILVEFLVKFSRCFVFFFFVFRKKKSLGSFLWNIFSKGIINTIRHFPNKISYVRLFLGIYLLPKVCITSDRGWLDQVWLSILVDLCQVNKLRAFQVNQMLYLVLVPFFKQVSLFSKRV